jgi:hypothetical protein
MNFSFSPIGLCQSPGFFSTQLEDIVKVVSGRLKCIKECRMENVGTLELVLVGSESIFLEPFLRHILLIVVQLE